MSSIFPAKQPTTIAATFLHQWHTLCKPAESGRSCAIILVAVSAVLFFYGVHIGDLWRTEGLRAIIAQEFLNSGNWVVPRLYGEPLFTKPPGMYAAIALCSLPFGEVTTLTARLPSALAATASVFLFFWYFSRQLGRRVGLIAALCLPVSVFFLEKSSAAEIDMLQVFWTTGAILFFLRALETQKSWIWWQLAFVFVTGGLLTKWTTPAFFYTTAAPLLWWRGQLRLLFCRGHLTGLALATCIFLAWAGAAVWLEGWTPIYATIKAEALQRLAPGYNSKPYPWFESLMHPLKILAVMLPLSLFALLTLRSSFCRLWDVKGKHLLAALHCWVWPNALFWSLPSDHTLRNSAPLFPAIAGLAAMVFVAWTSGKLQWRMPRLAPLHVLAGILVCSAVLKIAYVHGVVVQRTAERNTQSKGQLLASLLPADRVLYIFRIKDEGIMFYYGGKVIRLSLPKGLPVTDKSVYCLLLPDELASWPSSLHVQVIRRLTDSQSDPIILVRVTRR